MRFGEVGILLANGFARLDEPRHAAYNPADAKTQTMCHRRKNVYVVALFMLLRTFIYAGIRRKGVCN